MARVDGHHRRDQLDVRHCPASYGDDGERVGAHDVGERGVAKTITGDAVDLLDQFVEGCWTAAGGGVDVDSEAHHQGLLTTGYGLASAATVRLSAVQAGEISLADLGDL